MAERKENIMYKPRVFISAPYTKDPSLWTAKTIDFANIILKKGGIPFIPHLTHFWHNQTPKDWEEWIVYDTYWLEVCDCLVWLGEDVKSKGRDFERSLAKSMGKREYTEREVLSDTFLFIRPGKEW